MNVADAMTPREELVTVSVPGTRGDVLEYLQERAFSSVPVVKETDAGEEFRGLVSRERLIDEPDEDQLAMLVEEVETVASDDDLTAVARLVVETGQRRVPVLDDGSELAGIITITDVVRAIAEGDADGDTAVGDLADERINAVYEGTPLPVAERELSHASEPYGVVLGDDCRVAGILTEVDVLEVAEVVEGEENTGDGLADEDEDWKWEGIQAIGSRYLPTRNVEIPDGPVGEYMTADLVTLTGRRTAMEAAQQMISHDIEQIPLMAGDELAGIVRDVDLLEALT